MVLEVILWMWIGRLGFLMRMLVFCFVSVSSVLFSCLCSVWISV